MNKYFNRELSWLEFNKRVLKESFDNENSLGEQLNFLSIFSSNLDEFFMVRVGSLWDQFRSNKNIKDISGYTTKEQIKLINLFAKKILKIQYKKYEKLKKILLDKGIEITSFENLTKKEKNKAYNYYVNYIYPILTPIVFEKNEKIPLIYNKTINFLLVLKKNNTIKYGNLKIPNRINRLIEIKNKKKKKFITIESLLKNQLKKLYFPYIIKNIITYRITRNADLNYNEEGAEDLLVKVENLVKKRKSGKIIRIEIEENININLKKLIKKFFLVNNDEIYIINSQLDLTFLTFFQKKKWFKKYKTLSFEPKKIINTNSSEKFFKWIDKRDRIYHLPYDDFSVVLKFIKLAAEDDKVLSIKQTLYRVSKNSPIIDLLELAAKNGKNVTVLLEIKARFDEENNIHWTKRLEKAGVHVIHGPNNLKTHAKILVVIKKDKNNKTKTYCHFSSGNYNEKTAKIYEDIGLFTSNKLLAKDSVKFFNYLSSHVVNDNFEILKISPFESRNFIKKMIDYEIEETKKGNKAKICLKMNSLIDKLIIDKLYEAGREGVKIQLIIRGICSLIPNKNIKVKSIIGRFLEHSRIFYFYNGGKNKIFISSLDCMERNFNRRIELIIEIIEEKNKLILLNILKKLCEDNIKSYFLKNNGTYFKINKKNKLNVQNYFLNIRKRENSNI